MRHYGVCIPNNMASDRTFEDLDLSQDEMKRLGEALKDEKFRKMLVEYAEEISDPENRRKAEEEIAMMESERGMNVQFIHPQPGYVMKTTVDGSTKAFINICQNDKVEKPKAKRETGPDGKSGMMWQIPHSFAPPKEDRDNAKKQCQVFDVVFHPDTFRMATTNARFKKLVEDTAVDGIERQFNVTLDRKNIKYPKMKFKGTPTATIIRERKSDAEQNPIDPDNIVNQMPYPYDNKTSAEKAKSNEEKGNQKNAVISNGVSKKEETFTEPRYTITHRSELDMSEYRNAPDAKPSTRPKALVVKIELPLLKSAAQASLDIFEKRLLLESVSPAAYKLDLALPFPVNDDEGSAKFDKSKRTLTVTLPVIAEKTPSLPFGDSEATDGQQTSEVIENEGPPLIEVLSDAGEVDYIVENGVVEHDSQKDKLDNEKRPNFPQNVKWSLPEYQYSQDNETVSFVLKVQSVEEQWIQTFYPQSTVAVIQFMSMGAGCFPVYYSLYIEFPDSCKVSSKHCTVDTSDDNLVFVILKEKNCRGLWDCFKVGVDDTNLQVQQFLTECNLRQELATLQEEESSEAMPAQDEATPQLAVSEMNQHRLTIDIKPPKSKKKLNAGLDDDEEDEADSYDPPSSAEIEVVHRHPRPNLHSILKQRTVSESSEDFGMDDPSSPRSAEESDPLASSSSSFTKRRSVSFNSYVDRASFKSSASPSSMTPALKSKRRRQRKREMKLNGKQRRTSEGTSEGSSEEFPHSAMCDSHSHSEEEVDPSSSAPGTNGSSRAWAPLSRALSDPGPSAIGQEPTGQSKKRGKRGGRNKKGASKKCEGENESSDRSDDQLLSTDSDSRVIPGAEDELDFRTKMSEPSQAGVCDRVSDGVRDNGSAGTSSTSTADSSEKAQSEKNKKIVSEIKTKMAASTGQSGEGDGVDKEEADSDDDFVDAVSSMAEEMDSKLKIDNSLASRNGGGDEAKEGTTISGLQDKVGTVEDASSEKDGGDGKKADLQEKAQENGKDADKPKSEVDTMLSWEERPVNGGEHATQCAFNFSNSLLYDLDMD
ncbi:protein kintoun [Aplysia californica]|uniref:Protein kintoun n=1 Tax=Aplysia californica TaxID=6500 RepID=A0ABM0JNM5_APLCA|nr:protein kintoun [Aplysia californica]